MQKKTLLAGKILLCRLVLLHGYNCKSDHPVISRCSMKKIRELIVFTAFLVVALWKFDVVIEVLKSIWKIVFPFALGGAIAFVINVPMSLF